MDEKITVQLPPIEIWQDPTKRWCWKRPNGVSGTHEASARNAAIVAVSGMGIPLANVALPEPPKPAE